MFQARGGEGIKSKYRHSIVESAASARVSPLLLEYAARNKHTISARAPEGFVTTACDECFPKAGASVPGSLESIQVSDECPHLNQNSPIGLTLSRYL